MARSFDQVLAEITARSDPQRKIVLDQISQLPTQQAADEASLEAKKNVAYDDILNSARRRGLGFSGIPLGEQAQYAATDYAPAVANLKSTYGNRRGTLESALADIGKTDYSTAYDVYNQDRNFEEQQRQFNANMAAQSRAAAAQSNPYAGLFGNVKGAQTQAPAADPNKDRAARAVMELIGTNNKSLIQKTYDAIYKSASYGNAYDALKLQLLQQAGYKGTSNKPLPGLGTPVQSNPYPSNKAPAGVSAANNILKRLGA